MAASAESVQRQVLSLFCGHLSVKNSVVASNLGVSCFLFIILQITVLGPSNVVDVEFHLPSL